PPGGPERWSNIKDGHELYCAGHLYEAAVAWYEATGKRDLLEVALKNADLICRVFGPGKREDPPGHEEIEIGLVRLYRLTGEEKYLRQAKFFLDARGRPEGHRLYGKYAQDHKPVVEQEEAVGHAVRAAYLYTGMADVAALTGDTAYVRAIRRIWEDVVSRKLYVTGGIGAAGHIEGFGAEYFLPNRTAYCETCASVANAMWNHRMFLWTGDARYMDVVERVVYNAFLSGISMQGDRFFYPNRLETGKGERRQPWFSCACCPANIVRFVPSIPGYAWAHTDRDVWVNLYMAGEARLKVGAVPVRFVERTRYPWEGRVTIEVRPDRPARFGLRLRLPGWARNEPVPSRLYRFVRQIDWTPRLRLNGRSVPAELVDGYLRLERTWQAGDVVELDLPMPPRRVVADERVEADRGRVALQRGPLVFSLEAVDQPGGHVLDVAIPDEAPLWTSFRPDLLGGVQVITGEGRLVGAGSEGTAKTDAGQPFTGIPYYAWAHREPCAMTVWPLRAP
ncbi:MAG: glycoside hydrolase family 127 protein, partial [Verrucomicrobia bacterium]